MITRDAVGRFAAGHHLDPGPDALDPERAVPAGDPPIIEVRTTEQDLALQRTAGLIAGVAGCDTAVVDATIDRFRNEYLDIPEEQRPITPEDFAGGFRGRNPDTRTAPQDPATVWAHFRALHDPDAFPASDRLITSVDLETAGPEENWYDPAAGYIIEIGMVTYRPDGTEHSRFNQLVRPPQAFLEEHGTGNQTVHHISPEMVSDQPGWAEVSDRVGTRLAGSTLLAQNQQYEKNWLTKHLPGFDADAPSIDPMPLSRLLHRGMKKHTLSAICERLGIPYADAHRSTPDAEMAARAFFTMRTAMHARWRTEFAEQDGDVGHPARAS